MDQLLTVSENVIQLDASERLKPPRLNEMRLATRLSRVDLCSRGCYVASPPAMSQNYKDTLNLPHGFSDEGEPFRARAGDAQDLGGDEALPGDSKISRGPNCSFCMMARHSPTATYTWALRSTRSLRTS